MAGEAVGVVGGNEVSTHAEVVSIGFHVVDELREVICPWQHGEVTGGRGVGGSGGVDLFLCEREVSCITVPSVKGECVSEGVWARLVELEQFMGEVWVALLRVCV